MTTTNNALTPGEVEGEYGGTAVSYRRADLPPTLSAAMELPEVKALVNALTLVARAHDLREFYHALPNDRHRIGEKRSPKGHAREAWLRAFRKSAKAAAAALAAIKEPKT